VHDTTLLVRRHEELEPLVRPDQKEAKKPDLPPDFDVGGANSPLLEGIVSEVRRQMSNPDVEAVLDPSAVQATQYFTDELESAIKDQAASEESRTRRSSSIRRGIWGLAGVLSTITIAAAGGASANVLTSPQAAETFASNIQSIFQLILGLF